jgi:hypothetical protein
MIDTDMKKGSDHHVAHGVIGLLVVGIGFVLFYKLATNMDAFSSDLYALRNYVVLSILSMGFLTVLFFLSSRPHHKAVKASSSKKKKKK